MTDDDIQEIGRNAVDLYTDGLIETFQLWVKNKMTTTDSGSVIISDSDFIDFLNESRARWHNASHMIDKQRETVQ